MATEVLKVVKFIKPLDGYKIDDCASFEVAVADRVIAAQYGIEIQLEDTNLSKLKK